MAVEGAAEIEAPVITTSESFWDERGCASFRSATLPPRAAIGCGSGLSTGANRSLPSETALTHTGSYHVRFEGDTAVSLYGFELRKMEKKPQLAAKETGFKMPGDRAEPAKAEERVEEKSNEDTATTGPS